MEAISMDDTADFTTREEFARSFVPAFKQAMKIIERKAAGGGSWEMTAMNGLNH
jgi:hypothetical protein